VARLRDRHGHDERAERLAHAAWYISLMLRFFPDDPPTTVARSAAQIARLADGRDTPIPTDDPEHLTAAVRADGTLVVDHRGLRYEIEPEVLPLDEVGDRGAW
jgi:hypothetical protein